MTTFLLDSDVLMDFFKKKKEAVELIVRLSEEGDLTASVLSVAELRAGWTEKQAREILPNFYKLLTISFITTNISELAGQFRQEYKTKGITPPLIDVLIGATTLVNNYQLVTRNKKDYLRLRVKLHDF